MTAAPASQTIRSPGWIAAAASMAVALAFVYFALFLFSADQWFKKAEYSHGVFVPFFSLYLAWHWRSWAPKRLVWPEPWGLAFVAVGAGLFLIAGLANWAKEWLQGVSFVLNLTGMTLLLGGWKTLRWLWPSLAFLMFMFPLPWEVERRLGWSLQKIATSASTFFLQTFGYPAYSQGNVIHIGDLSLGVEAACNGLSMLLTFFALAIGTAILVNRPTFDRVLILLSAIPIAVVSNIVRIVATGVLYMEAGEEVGRIVFHDLAGWLMMPFALGLMWLELKALDWVYVADLAKASSSEVIRDSNENPAFLFMLNNPALGPSKPKDSAPRAGR